MSIYVDLKGKCLKGADANLYVENNLNCVTFIGNGWLNLDRDEIFKSSVKTYTFCCFLNSYLNYWIKFLFLTYFLKEESVLE